VYTGHPDRSEGPMATSSLARDSVGDVSFVVDGRPDYVVVDPELRFIDRNPDDNVFHLP
jgi:hypothetical protein